MVSQLENLTDCDQSNQLIDQQKSGFDYYAVSDPDISLETCPPEVLDVYAALLD